MNRTVELRDHQRELYLFQLRLALIGGAVVTAFAILFLRFFYVQVFQHDHYHTLAEQNRIVVVPVVPNRGLILDRNGAVLAHDFAAYTLEITPSLVDDIERVINDLAVLVEITPKDRKRFQKLIDEGHDFGSVPIRTRLNDLEVARFAVKFAGSAESSTQRPIDCHIVSSKPGPRPASARRALARAGSSSAAIR